jgi:hypothetical protein
MFYVDYINGKRIVKSDLLQEVTHFFTTRDICVYSKDEDMSANLKEVKEYLGVKNVAVNRPVHGHVISTVEKDKYFYENSDGLLLKGQGAMMMNFGDCTPLLFYCDGVAVISHAGWRGTVQKIAQLSFQKLVAEYKFKPKNIKAVIGPAICKECYEVGEDVYQALYNTVENPENCFEKRNNNFFVDLKNINKQQLLECGIEKIDVCPYCTACGEKLFYSYRYQNHTGYRHTAVLKI